MRVTLLGTGTPAPSVDRQQSSVLLEPGGTERLLVDAGCGTIRQLATLGVPIDSISHIFITHHHVDHFSELFDLMITSAMCGRTGPLTIVGPRGTEAIVRALVDGVYAKGIRAHALSIEQQKARGHCDDSVSSDVLGGFTVTDVEPGAVVDAGSCRVVADEVLHGDYSDIDPEFEWTCLGYRIESDGKVVVISGDTVPCAGIIRLAQDADLLVQCSHFPERVRSIPTVQEMTRHTLPTAGQAGEIASAAGVGHLVLTHLSMQISGAAAIAEVKADAEAQFDGPVTVGEDLMVFDI